MPTARSTAHATRSPGWGSSPKAAPTQDELVYAHHDRGFALYSMRCPEITRLYLQVPPDDRRSTDWSDDRIWDELATRACRTDGFD